VGVVAVCGGGSLWWWLWLTACPRPRPHLNNCAAGMHTLSNSRCACAPLQANENKQHNCCRCPTLAGICNSGVLSLSGSPQAALATAQLRQLAGRFDGVNAVKMCYDTVLSDPDLASDALAFYR
jgi:hypothetical protein